jgi:hypothetical protein
MVAGAGGVASGRTPTPPPFASPFAPMFQVPAAPTAGYYYPTAPPVANYYQQPAAPTNPLAGATSLESYWSYLGDYDPAQPQAPVFGGAAIAATVGPFILNELSSLLASGKVDNNETALTNAALGIFQKVVGQAFHQGAGNFQLLPNGNDRKVLRRIVNFVLGAAGVTRSGTDGTTAPSGTTTPPGTTSPPGTGTSAKTITITITVTGADVQVKTDTQGGTTSTVAPAGSPSGTPPPNGGQAQPNTPNPVGVSPPPAVAPAGAVAPPPEPAPQGTTTPTPH